MVNDECDRAYQHLLSLYPDPTQAEAVVYLSALGHPPRVIAPVLGISRQRVCNLKKWAPIQDRRRQSLANREDAIVIDEIEATSGNSGADLAASLLKRYLARSHRR